MSKIMIGSHQGLFYLHWSEDEAAFIGDSTRPSDAEIFESSGEERENAIVEQAAHDSPGATKFGGELVWHTYPEAKVARSLCLAALKAAKENRKPEPWEPLALAAGWRPPAKARRR